MRNAFLRLDMYYRETGALYEKRDDYKETKERKSTNKKDDGWIK